MKTGLDDYLCKHTVEEFKALPVIEVKALTERIAEATQENYNELLPEIADLDDEIQKEILCKALSKKIDVNYRTIKSAVKVFEKGKEPVISESNIIIVHPSYDIHNDFLVLGFRETVVKNNQPEDRNFFVISTQEGYILHDEKILQYADKNIIFDERDRFLLRAEDRWRKQNILAFIKNPVSPIGLYEEIKQILRQYIEFQKEAVYGLVTAWTIATYFFLIFHAFPFLFIYGKKQSGKSRLLDFLERLCFNAMKVKGVSVASMTDSIDGVRGTFLNDQAESLSDSRNAEILGILADSYTVGGGKRRIVDISNKRRRVVEFGTYAPKAFASVKEIDTDLKDRCIQIIMLRAIKDYPYPEAYLPIWHDIRDKVYRLLLTKWREAREIYTTTGAGVSHRVRELWRPIETILTLEQVSGSEVNEIKAFFLESMIETQAELSDSEHEVFEILLETTKETGETILTVEDIAKKIKIKPREDMTEKGLQVWTGKLLNQLRLYTKKLPKNDKKRPYYFTYDQVKNIYIRYTKTDGLDGEMVKNLKNSQVAINHIKNGDGIDGKGDEPSATISENEMVKPNPLINNDLNHITNSTNTYIEQQPLFVNTEVD
jgi:hypothetical protein